MQTSVDSLIQSIKSRLIQELHVNIQNVWLSDCVKYFVQRDSNYDLNSLYESAKDQFQLAEIADTSNQVISNMFFSKKKDYEWKLDNKMLLQMQYIIEISEAPYEQWRRLHNIILDDLNPEAKESKTFHTKKKRMFKLELTDGYKTIHAMEMKFIKCLNSKLKPGTKVLISGPVKVVNAILFLEPGNIKILGGEVDDLMVVNAYENILLKLLKKPPVENPVQDYKEAVYDEDTSNRNNPRQIQSVPMREGQPTIQQQSIVQPQQQEIDPFDDDDIDFELLAQIEAEENRKHEERQKRLAPKSFFQSDRYEEEEQRIDSTGPPPPKKPDLHREAAIVPKANDLLIPNIVPQPSYMSEEMEIDDIPQAVRVPVRKSTFTDDDYEYRIGNMYNYVTIDQYSALSKCEKMKRQYAIEARVANVIKCRIEGQSWTFLAQLTDIYSKSLLNVRFTDDIVAGFAKRTAREMIAMKDRVAEQPQLREDMLRALKLVSDTTENVIFLMSVTMRARPPADYENVIENIIYKTDEVSRLINRKVANENISLVL